MSVSRAKKRLVSPPRWLVLHLLAGWAGSRVLHELLLLPEESPVRGYGQQKVWPVAVYGFSRRHGMVGAFLWRIFFMGHLGLRADWMLPNVRVPPIRTHAHSALGTIIITSSQSHPIKRRKTFLATSCTNQYLIKDSALLPTFPATSQIKEHNVFRALLFWLQSLQILVYGNVVGKR